MMHNRIVRNRLPYAVLPAVLLAATLLVSCDQGVQHSDGAPRGREEVVFWHFWGGKDRPVVDGIVKRFNDSQQQYVVRAIALPGNNLDLKFFLSVAGGDPPDLMNHDDPVVADWAEAGLLTPLNALANDSEIAELRQWLFPAARRLGTYQERLFALCNGLDVRALYCNKSVLDEHDLSVPTTINELDEAAATIAPPEPGGRYDRMGFLPDPRRLWAWGTVFGGDFLDQNARNPQGMITADSSEIVRALAWMAGYSRRYGVNELGAFRSGEQAVSGAAFALLQNRRYAMVMDGQWRVRDIEAAQEFAEQNNQPFDEFVVAPLPSPPDGKSKAGWINGNFFVIPANATNKTGAWEFAKFWTGYGGTEAQAAVACAQGGWIPASQRVVDQPAYQQALQDHPLLRTFVDLASSENQEPTPPIPAAAYYVQQINQTAEHLLFRDPTADPKLLLRAAASRVRNRLKEALDVR